MSCMKTNHDYIPCAGCGAQLEETNCRYCGRESEYVFFARDELNEIMIKYCDRTLLTTNIIAGGIPMIYCDKRIVLKL